MVHNAVTAPRGGTPVQPELPVTDHPTETPFSTAELLHESPEFNVPSGADRETVPSGECPQKKTEKLSTESEEAHKAAVLRLADDLAKTNNTDHLLAAAVLSQSSKPDLLLELLYRANRIDPSHPLVANTLLRMCRERKGANCDLAAAESKAIRADGGNGATWLEVAMFRLGEGQTDAAADAIRRAIAAPRFTHYFMEHALTLERALAAIGGKSYRDRVIEGIGYSAAFSFPAYGAITRHCEALEHDDARWIELCDQLGEKMFADGRSVLNQAIGKALQRIAARRSNDEARIKTATAELEAFRAYRDQVLGNRDAQALLFNDETVLAQYVEDFLTYGEMSAQEKLGTEAQRLKRVPGYDQCNFVSRWVL